MVGTRRRVAKPSAGTYRQMPLDTATSTDAESAHPFASLHHSMAIDVGISRTTLANLTLIERVVAHHNGIQLIPCMRRSLGVEFAVEHQPESIFLALHLPDPSGETLFEQLQSNPLTATTLVVIVSTDATSGRIQRLIAWRRRLPDQTNRRATTATHPRRVPNPNRPFLPTLHQCLDKVVHRFGRGGMTTTTERNDLSPCCGTRQHQQAVFAVTSRVQPVAGLVARRRLDGGR